MSKRLWLFGVMGLVSIGFLIACGSKYNSSSDGLMLVGSQGSSVIQTFSFNLNNGHISGIANSTGGTGNQTCILNGSPASMVTDPKGGYLYVAFNSSTVCPNATSPCIAIFQIKSDGNITQVGDLLPDPNPVALSMDAAGKFLFVAEGTGGGLVNSYVIDGGSLTIVPGTFNFANGNGFQPPNIVALAATPTVFPQLGINGVQNSVCQVGVNPPTTEFLYAVDSVNYVLWEFSVDTTTGALGNPVAGTTAYVPTDTIPAGVAVDPCNRFVYVSNSLSNKISAYTICNGTATQSPLCTGNGLLLPITGSPISVTGGANGLGPIVVDPFGNNVYVVGTLSNTLSGFKISPVSGGLTTLSPATVATGNRPTSIAIRADDNWMFVANFNSGSVSQYSITPATGALTAESPITTDNQPFGVAVK